MTDVQEILEIITCVIIALFVLFLLVVLIWNALAKEHPCIITVVRKHENSFRYRHAWGWSDYSGMHYVVECTYHGSDKIHKLVCNGYAEYAELIPGRTYTVKVKQYWIMSVEKKHKRK